MTRKSKAKLKAKQQRIRNERLAQQSLPTGENPVNLRPIPLASESQEDLAVFTKEVREQLPLHLQGEASLVGEALDLVERGDFAQATERLAGISRTSPYADWRLFIRGLVGFYSLDRETAKQNWGRLDATRRPGRIARTLLFAEADETVDGDTLRPPQKLVDAAKKLRTREHVIAAAKQIAIVKHRDPETVFSMSQVAMLNNFRETFRKSDSEFVERFSQACVRLAFFQMRESVFEILKNSVPAPVEDPKWNLLNLLYTSQFLDESGIEPFLEAKAALLADLPKQSHLTAEVKAALASCIHLQHTELELIEASARTFLYFAQPPPDVKAIDKLFEDAIACYPKNRIAHQKRIEFVKAQLGTRRLTKVAEKSLEGKLVTATEQLVSNFPDEVESTLWLIDECFDNDELDRADMFVRQLAGQRLENPLAKALPWKLKLREAMHLSRRKNANIAANEALSSAEGIWPTWCSKHWLPYLKAALALRSGQQDEFSRLSLAARQGSGVSEWVGDIMLFAAMQQMNIPSAGLKSMRAVVDQHLKNINALPLKEAFTLGSFFWDLKRTGLAFKAYRTQASKLGGALAHRLPREKYQVDAAALGAIAWTINERYILSRNLVWLERISSTEPQAAAAMLNMFVKNEFNYEIFSNKAQVLLLEEAARTENDVFYRYEFERVAKAANACISEFERQQKKETECDCPACRARRARASRKQRGQVPPSGQASFFDFLYDDDDDDDDDDDLDDDLDEGEDEDDDFFDGDLDEESIASLARVFSRLGQQGALDLFSLIERESLPSGKPKSTMSAMIELLTLFTKHDLSVDDASIFMKDHWTEVARFRVDGPESPRQPSGKAMTAEERRELNKQRKKELDKRRKQRQ